jgi:hypothetical protein
MLHKGYQRRHLLIADWFFFRPVFGAVEYFSIHLSQ